MFLMSTLNPHSYADFQYEVYLAEDRSDLPFDAAGLEWARELSLPPGVQLRGQWRLL